MQKNPKSKELVRLNKLIAQQGYCSRRKADEFIQQGLVKLNGKIINELGFKASSHDNISINGKKLSVEKHVYFAVNKPKNVLCTVSDPRNRNTIVSLIDTQERIFPVGRLDRNTTGVILLTNDGDFSYKLTHPKFNIKKEYVATLSRNLTAQEVFKLAKGIELSDGFIKFDFLTWPFDNKNNKLHISLHSGKNRIIRRVFEYFDISVLYLDRISFAGITKHNIFIGSYRPLKKSEISSLLK